jgi:hypothetical protein
MTDKALALARRRLDDPPALWFLRLVLILASLLTFWLAAVLGQGGVLFVFWRRTLLVFALAGLALVMLVAAWAAGRLKSRLRLPSRPSSAESVQSAKADFASVGAVFNRLLFLLTAALLLFLFLGPFSQTFQSLPARFLLLFFASLLGTFLLSTKSFSQSWPVFLLNLLLFTSLYQLITNLQLLSFSPFSRGWSEGTRYYHASLLLSERYYNLSLPPFYQDLSRYVIEVIPLLLPHPSLWLERLWETALTFLLPALTAALMLRRVGRDGIPPSRQSAEYHSAPHHRAFWWTLLLFGTLFLLQGPVYFYLLFAAIPVLAFFHPDRLAPSILALIAASFWAGISRVNWIPIPAMLAVALYLLEKPIAKKSILRYLTPPVFYTVIGLVTAYAARQWYFSISGISDAMFNAAFWQQMLWYRLFPSSLNAWGILPSGLVMTAPLILLMLAHLRRRAWHPIRVTGLGLMLFILLAGGFIVSAKIGGGNNLHNLDGFLTLSLTVSFYLLFDRFVPDVSPASAPQAFSPLAVTLAALAVTVFTVSTAFPALPSFDRHADSLASLQQLVDETVADGGQVLFITQRHLLAFGLITGVPLVPEYDNIDLMEFAMTNYRPSIDRFHADIAAHKYALIIAPTPPGQLRTTDSAFSEENNAWLKRVSIPMLREYEILAEYPEGDFVVLVPDE